MGLVGIYSYDLYRHFHSPVVQSRILFKIFIFQILTNGLTIRDTKQSFKVISNMHRNVENLNNSRRQYDSINVIETVKIVKMEKYLMQYSKKSVS